MNAAAYAYDGNNVGAYVDVGAGGTDADVGVGDCVITYLFLPIWTLRTKEWFGVFSFLAIYSIDFDLAQSAVT